MPPRIKTFYLWDLAGTLFSEKWNIEKSGVANFHAYVESLGYDLKTVDPETYEGCYKIPYSEGLFDLSVAEGFQEVLEWTKNNGFFTTGTPAQIDWRAVQLKKRYNLDPRPFLPERFSTFDYGNTNVKTPEMLMDILEKKHAENYAAVVYTDDKSANCEFFLQSYLKVKNQVAPLKARAYYFTDNEQDIVQLADNYWQAGTLLQLRENEQRLDKIVYNNEDH